MFLSYLQLINFRSYENLELQLTPGITTYVGSNGEGKTNIVEAIGFLAYLRSHRTSSDNPLIKLGHEKAYIRAKVDTAGRDWPHEATQVAGSPATGTAQDGLGHVTGRG